MVDIDTPYSECQDRLAPLSRRSILKQFKQTLRRIGNGGGSLSHFIKGAIRLSVGGHSQVVDRQTVIASYVVNIHPFHPDHVSGRDSDAEGRGYGLPSRAIIAIQGADHR